ncbi:MAG: cation diffusion facilitator family transporter [Burkholderiales bacterium]
MSSPSRHSHAHAPRGRPAFVVALAITFGYALVELAGGLWSGSLALVSDAGHMFSDAAALTLAAFAAWLARRPASLRHTYGWARAEVIGALLNSLIMLGIIVVLVVEAVERLFAPQPVIAGGVVLIAFIGLVVNAAVVFVLSRGERSLNVRAALLHVLGDLVSSVAALIAGAVIWATGWLLIDPILSLVIAALILASTLRLLRDTLHVLMEGVPAAVDLEQIGKALARVPGVVSVHDLHVWGITPEHMALSAHLEVDDLSSWPDILEDARTRMHERFGIAHVTLQPEERGAWRPHTAVVRVWPKKKQPRP